MTATPWFHTHHAPAGARASLTFGLPGHGVSIDDERNAVVEEADLLVGWSEGGGPVRLLPFVRGAGLDSETVQAGLAGDGHWQVQPAAGCRRELGPAVDAYTCGPLRFRVLAPFPGPDLLGDEARWEPASRPAILLELALAPCAHDAVLLLGLRRWAGSTRMRPLDWTGRGLAGVAWHDRWALAADPAGGAFTVRDGSIGADVRAGRGVCRMAGLEGGIALRVPAGASGLLTAVFAWHRGGIATRGIATRYEHAHHHADVEAVCRAALADADGIRARAAAAEAAVAGVAPWRREILAQALQAYAANSQLLRDEADGSRRWCVTEGQYCWRNTLDLAADHLLFELRGAPWALRSVIARHAERWSYRDRIRLPGEAGFPHEGGLSFCHDQGNDDTCTPPGVSGYERAGVRGCYSHMTLEQLLNGVYCLCAGIHVAPGDAWSRAHRGLLRGCLDSLRRRDHPEPARRDGIPKAESARVGDDGAEITTYDALDESLLSAVGNTYCQIKAWCCCRLIEAAAGDDRALAAEAAAYGDTVAASLVAGFDHARGVFPANRLAPIPSLVLALLEPLAVPLACGLGGRLARDQELMALLAWHWRTCLATPGLHHRSGGLRLSSTSENTWPSKLMLVLAVAETCFGADLAGAEAAHAEALRRWLQELCRATTIADQIRPDSDGVIGGAWYPRHVTAAALLPGWAPEARQPG